MNGVRNLLAVIGALFLAYEFTPRVRQTVHRLRRRCWLRHDWHVHVRSDAFLVERRMESMLEPGSRPRIQFTTISRPLERKVCLRCHALDDEIADYGNKLLAEQSLAKRRQAQAESILAQTHGLQSPSAA